MAVAGFVIAMGLAIPMGVLIGLSRFAWRSTKFTFDFFKVIPPIVIIPIVILVLGPTMQMGIFLIVFTLVFAMSIQTGLGVRDADAVLLETMRCYGMSTWKQIRYARLPSAGPYIAVGVRLSASAALVVSIVAGLIGGAPGLGKSILLSQASGDDPRTFATVFVLGVIGIAVSRVVIWTQRKAIFWMPT
jgi:ABC-type nitrate/sulfonate/bicarbonate transport system permease component